MAAVRCAFVLNKTWLINVFSKAVPKGANEKIGAVGESFLFHCFEWVSVLWGGLCAPR